MLARVSNIEAFRRWRQNDDADLADLVRFITVDEPSEAMKAGTAFHAALEHAANGNHDVIKASDYIFRFVGGEIELPAIRELRAYKNYGDLTVTGQVDGLHARIVSDHKTTKRFDPERYLEGAQWKFYLDIFDADVFRWHVFEIRELAFEGSRDYEVSPPHILTAYRYPELHRHCAALASDYLDFARLHLPERFGGDDADALKANAYARNLMAG